MGNRAATLEGTKIERFPIWRGRPVSDAFQGEKGFEPLAEKESEPWRDLIEGN